MGFLKKVTKSVKKVAKKAEKIVKPVVKKAVPVAATALGAYLGGPAGAAIGSKLGGGLSSIFGSGVGSAIGKAAETGISGTIQDLFTGFGEQIAYGDSNGINIPKFKNPSTTQYEQYSAGPSDMMGGVNFINSMQTPIKTPTQQGQDTREYLAAAYPEMNPWERSGTGGTMFGGDMSGQIQSQEANNKQIAANLAIQKQQLAKDLALAKLQSDTTLRVTESNNYTSLVNAQLAAETSKHNTGLQSLTSRENTKDQVALGYENYKLQSTRLQADLKQIAASTNLTEQQKQESIARQIKTYAETNNVNISSGQIKAMTQKIMTETQSESLRQPGIIQENINKRYGTSQVGKSVSDASNVLSDLGSQAWDYVSTMFKDSDGVSGPMSRKN